MTTFDPALPGEIRRHLLALEAEVLAVYTENARLQQDNTTLREQLAATERAGRHQAAP